MSRSQKKSASKDASRCDLVSRVNASSAVLALSFDSSKTEARARALRGIRRRDSRGVTAVRRGCDAIPSQAPNYLKYIQRGRARPLICIINALIASVSGHRRMNVKRVAFQFASGAALSRDESNRYAR